MTLPGSGRDEVYRDPQNLISDFAFDEQVAQVFTDMIRRSVPAYETVVPLTGLLASRHARPGSRIYDLGCSLGATTLAILRQIGALECQLIAVDNAAAMIDRARTNVSDNRVTWLVDDIRTVDMTNASVVTLNYTLQFIAPDERLTLLRKIQGALTDGGVLIMSEKVRFEDAAREDYFVDAHHQFKRANGYSALEVGQKRAALENVMIIDSIDTHLERFHAAGFSQAFVWFQCLNWASFIAWR